MNSIKTETRRDQIVALDQLDVNYIEISISPWNIRIVARNIDTSYHDLVPPKTMDLLPWFIDELHRFLKRDYQLTARGQHDIDGHYKEEVYRRRDGARSENP